MSTVNTSLFSVFGGSIPGPPAKKRGKPNQDRFRSESLQDGSVIIAVADGAGSHDRSDEGAQIAVDVAVRYVAEAYANNVLEASVADSVNVVEMMQEILQDAIAEARSAVMSRDDWQHMGATLSVALMTENESCVAVVGDAFAVVCTVDGDIVLAENEQSSEHANITEMLTSKKPEVVVFTFSNASGVALSSDGLMHFTVDSKTKIPTEGFWRPVFSKASDGSLDVESLLRYMESLEKTDDDTTLALAVNQNASSAL